MDSVLLNKELNKFFLNHFHQVYCHSSDKGKYYLDFYLPLQSGSLPLYEAVLILNEYLRIMAAALIVMSAGLIGVAIANLKCQHDEI